MSIGNAQDDLRSSVESRLYVCVHSFVNEAGRAKINDLDARLIAIFKDDVLRLEITMDDHLLFYIVESIDDLDSESSDEIEREALEVSSLQEIIEIDAEKFKGDTQMVSKLIHILHSNDVVLVLRIMVSQMRKDLHLDLRLVLKLLAVLDDFESYQFLLLMVKTLYTLSK